ncbi:amidase signature domain-containing protein [Multifurca ochricompacta]|uniref:Glutamyl-tRNA(Gln) amidotransferase subunit A, mitochondrial n=1 Tax=Multifurca ochricompacta TaxID=376703 RepID=A0AAD4QJS7_9AGAM|nr:amidase signature domain-containing protein [Multifurca ochricompacta]
MTVAVKDNICTKDMPTTCSSAMLRNFKSPFDATVVRLLNNSGATIVGKANCDEFGMGSLNVHSVHGPVINPFQHPSSSVKWEERERRSAGGSSGGSGAAVAAACVMRNALATDTGGSVRLPASYCGIVGLKPSYGLISRWGVVSFADSLDCVGIIGRDAACTSKLFDILSVFDERDPTAARPTTREKARELCSEHMAEWVSSDATDLTNLRIGIPQEYFPTSLDKSIVSSFRRVVRALKHRGATVLPVSLPNTSYALSAYYVISSAEASSNLARYDGVQYGLHVPLPPGVKRRILLGTYALTADAFDNYFLQAQHLRQCIREDFMRVFRVPNPLARMKTAITTATTTPHDPAGVHVLLHLSAVRTAPLLDSDEQDGLHPSLAGLPALSVPIAAGAEGDGWPLGVTVVGQWGCEKMVLAVGASIEGVKREDVLGGE